MGIVIRDYQESDYSELISLLREVYNSEITREVLEKHYITSSRSVLVAIEGSEHVVGCAFVEIQEDYVRPRKIAYATYVAVDGRYRKQGIGRTLLNTVVDICKKNNCEAIELTSANYRTVAHEFYKSIGFTKKKTSVFIKEIN